MAQPLEDRLINRFNKQEILNIIGRDDDSFNQMVQITLSNKDPKSWRAPWVLSHAMTKNDKRIKPYLKSFIEAIDGKKDGYQREILKIISRMEVPEDMEGMLFDKCTAIWEIPGKSPGTRIVAIRIMLKIARKYPELKNDIMFLTQDHYAETLSPGIKKSLAKLMKES